MENAAVSRRNQTNKKGNKENAQPAIGTKSFIKRDKTSAPPLQLKSNKKEEASAHNGPLKAKSTQMETRPTTGSSGLNKVKTVQRSGTSASVPGVKQRQTHSQAFLTQQAARHKKLVAEAPKPPPPSAPGTKSAPGMYKGKIIQSKIGSIWKSSTSLNAADPKPSAPRTESRTVEDATKVRSKSVADLTGRGTHKPVPARSKSVSERPGQGAKSTTSHRPAGFYSARPPARTVPATLTNTSSRNTKAGPTKGSGAQTSKPKVPVTDRKVNKPPVTSTLSQYRVTMETAEERRAKLANWQASKGKAFKRPAMVKAAPTKTKATTKPEAQPRPQMAAQRNPEPDPEPEPEPGPEPSLEAHKPNTELPTHSQTPAIMNTTLDLLENSDVDLSEPQERVDDIVLNLCDALEAMATPSICDDEGRSEVTDVSNDVDESKREGMKNEVPRDVSEQLKEEQVKEEEESDEEVVTDDDDDDDVMETTPEAEGASMVKYSVKTTPYLQSVKKTIEGEAVTSTSKRKSNIKDLKFLTPVRRSCRIQRKSSRLPTMLVDHDPCVSSLAELVTLDDESNAYIYRKNPALLEDLPDQPRA